MGCASEGRIHCGAVQDSGFLLLLLPRRFPMELTGMSTLRAAQEDGRLDMETSCRVPESESESQGEGESDSDSESERQERGGRKQKSESLNNSHFSERGVDLSEVDTTLSSPLTLPPPHVSRKRAPPSELQQWEGVLDTLPGGLCLLLDLDNAADSVPMLEDIRQGAPARRGASIRSSQSHFCGRVAR